MSYGADIDQHLVSGRLVADPEEKLAPSGAWAVFRLASNVGRRTNYYTAKAWRQNADFALKHLRKGDFVVLAGQTEIMYAENGRGILGVGLAVHTLQAPQRAAGTAAAQGTPGQDAVAEPPLAPPSVPVMPLAKARPEPGPVAEGAAEVADPFEGVGGPEPVFS